MFSRLGSLAGGDDLDLEEGEDDVQEVEIEQPEVEERRKQIQKGREARAVAKALNMLRSESHERVDEASCMLAKKDAAGKGKDSPAGLGETQPGGRVQDGARAF